CIVHGDPHYVTFDGLSLAFMGTCTYTTAKLCNSSSHLPYFNVETTNEYRNQGSISFVREVHTEVYGQNITLSLGRTLLLNEELVTPPLVLPGLHVSLSGSYLVLMTDFNLIVRFNGDNRAEVTVPREYAEELCGICGNFNGDRTDEYLMPDGTQASSPTELGNSWKTDNSSAYITLSLASGLWLWTCTIVIERTGLFTECHAVVNPEELFTSCVLDQCWTYGDKGTLCGSLQAYADECAENGIVIMWRNATFCRECKPDSHYESCAPPCPATCSNVTLPGACQQPCGEGCVCDEGFVFSGDKCVPQDQCGCLDRNDLYHPLGDHWFGTQNCSLHCSCVSVGDVVCDPWQCGANEICNVQNGTLGCHDIVSATCHVAGDPHYFTFDSALITYMGTCTYQLVSVCNADNVTPFTILAKNEERGQPNASYLKHVYVDIGSDRIHLKKKNVILLNGKKVKTPMIESLVPGVQFSIIGSYVHVVTDFGLVIKFDGVHHLSITLSSAYANKVIAV
uniref:VWFD domain-containing protein n=1 Tax=Petromyzon marinus TaxID=7757 RepID=S4RH74_PETMA